jgi:hypothetical protein
MSWCHFSLSFPHHLCDSELPRSHESWWQTTSTTDAQVPLPQPFVFVTCISRNLVSAKAQSSNALSPYFLCFDIIAFGATARYTSTKKNYCSLTTVSKLCNSPYAQSVKMSIPKAVVLIYRLARIYGRVFKLPTAPDIEVVLGGRQVARIL